MIEGDVVQVFADDAVVSDPGALDLLALQIDAPSFCSGGELALPKTEGAGSKTGSETVTAPGWRENQAAIKQSTVLATPNVCMMRIKASNEFMRIRLDAWRQSAVV